MQLQIYLHWYQNNSIYQLKSKTSVINCLLNSCYSKVEKRGNLTLTFNDNCTQDEMNMIRLAWPYQSDFCTQKVKLQNFHKIGNLQYMIKKTYHSYKFTASRILIMNFKFISYNCFASLHHTQQIMTNTYPLYLWNWRCWQYDHGCFSALMEENISLSEKSIHWYCYFFVYLFHQELLYHNKTWYRRFRDEQDLI